jgi:hypothetical protein
MTSHYHVHTGQIINDSTRYYLNPNDLHEEQVRSELERAYGPEHDPDKPPPPEPGEKYIMLGTTIGIILGGVLGGIISFVINWHFVAIILSIIGGIVIGGILGVFIGNSIKTHFFNLKNEPKYKLK